MKDIMGIEIENMSAASAVRRIMGLLAREPLSVCTVLRADMLLLAEKDEEYREYLSQTALRIVGDAAILKAMGEERKRPAGRAGKSFLPDAAFERTL